MFLFLPFLSGVMDTLTGVNGNVNGNVNTELSRFKRLPEVMAVR